MKELIFPSKIVTGKIYCSKLTNNLLFVCKDMLKQSKKEFFARVKSAFDLRYGNIAIDLTAAAIDITTDLPISSIQDVQSTFFQIFGYLVNVSKVLN